MTEDQHREDSRQDLEDAKAGSSSDPVVLSIIGQIILGFAERNGAILAAPSRTVHRPRNELEDTRVSFPGSHARCIGYGVLGYFPGEAQVVLLSERGSVFHRRLLRAASMKRVLVMADRGRMCQICGATDQKFNRAKEVIDAPTVIVDGHSTEGWFTSLHWKIIDHTCSKYDIGHRAISIQGHGSVLGRHRRDPEKGALPAC